MNHFFLPSLIPLTKGNTGLEGVSRKKKSFILSGQAEQSKGTASHTCLLEIPGFARNDRMLFCPQKFMKNGNV